eukprot:TRINITY_DN76326_c0_g1_i1.p1 TRINITY_DN76326_c0_g1~~TRINITY_DN76326_c0_g1_i1.p1  ORF type:complete len:337 (-),score=25.10 TRINITY_DN76326_c0_g1_i1:60-1049(-)
MNIWTKLAPQPPYTPEGTRFDPKTYLGRCLQFYDQTSTSLVFVGAAGLKKAQDLLSSPKGKTDEELWAARRVVDGVKHPDTGKPIPALFRFCAFAPVNYCIIPIMLNPAVMASVPLTIGIHWLNQSYNCAVNYANRNASNPVSTRRLGEAYTGAVLSSCSIALGATFLTRKAATWGGSASTIVRSTVPFLAVASAGFANVALIRRNELKEGVDMLDESGKCYGKSVAAGKIGLTKCGLARVFWNLPTMTVAPLLLSRIAKMPAMKKSKALMSITEVLVLGTAIRFGVPPALAVFPQQDAVDVKKLEQQFQNLKDENGNPITTLYYNKGL